MTEGLSLLSQNLGAVFKALGVSFSYIIDIVSRAFGIQKLGEGPFSSIKQLWPYIALLET